MRTPHPAVGMRKADGVVVCPYDDGIRLHHLSVAEPDSRLARNTLIFRDALREDPAPAHEYAALKERLALRPGIGRLEYLNGKTDFVLGVLRERGGELGGDYPTIFVGSPPA